MRHLLLKFHFTAPGGKTVRSMATLAILIIDPQIDYMPGGSCPIPTAENVAIRIAELIGSSIDKISSVYVSLDTHHRMSISFSSYWQSGENGDAPPSWTVINNADIENGVWGPRISSALPKVLAYTAQLETQNKPSLMIWPEHCLLGTKGSAVCKSINDAIQDWAAAHESSPIEYLIKGTNSSTEMHSIFEAEIPDPEDPSTCFNLTLLERLSQQDKLLICGFSLSHSIDRTLRHMLPKLSSEKKNCLFLINDCVASIPGHESAGERLIQFAQEQGVRVIQASEIQTIIQ